MNCTQRTPDRTSGMGGAWALLVFLLLAVVGSPGRASDPEGFETPLRREFRISGELQPCVKEALAHYGDLFDEALPAELASAETRCFLHAHPTFYFDPDDGERIESQATDLLLAREMGDEAVFSLEVQASNGHSCHIWGVAARAADGYFFEKVLDGDLPDSERCRLRLVVHDERAEVEDVGNRCRRYYCGVRASIGRLELEERPRDGSH